MRNRITIQTTEKLERALEEICTATGRSSKSDVVRDSIELYALIVSRFIDNDEHLFLGVTPESAARVLLPHLERAANRGARPMLASVPAVPEEAAPEGRTAQRVRPTGRKRATGQGSKSGLMPLRAQVDD